MTEESPQSTPSPSLSSSAEELSFKVANMEKQRPNLPPIWSDYMEVAFRGDAPIVMLRFYSTIPQDPPILLETVRIQTTASQIKAMINALCLRSGYYPERPESESSGSSESSESD